MQSAIKLEEETTPDGGWTEAQRFAITEELKCILKDPTFNHSKRCVTLLHWIVERTLANDCDGLKERTVGMAVFGRNADYDTNNDPVVRMAANEVRKRLAMYYQNPSARRAVVRIRLLPGSYIPEFSFHKSDSMAEEETFAADDQIVARGNIDAQKTEAVATDEESDKLRATEETLSSTAPLIKKAQKATLFKRRWPILLGGALLVVVALGCTTSHMNFFHSSQYMAWAPLLAPKANPIICLSEAAYSPQESSLAQSAGGAASRRISTTNKDFSPLPLYYAFEDLNVAHKISLWLAGNDMHLTSFGSQIALRQPQDISLWEFRHQPVVLIGAADNLWASTFLSTLRFTPKRDPITGLLSIHDSQNPTRRNLTPSGPAGGNAAVDYAIVTRYQDVDTGNWIFSIGGLGPHGTEAAGQLMIDPHFTKEFPSAVRSKKNFQIIVKTIAVNGKTGIPQIVDFYAW